MPMFYTPKPRQFHYKPRLYDPEKEEFEKLKAKYRIEKGLPIDDDQMREAVANGDAKAQLDTISDETLESLSAHTHIDVDRHLKPVTFSDLFHKHEKPEFHYVSRFDENGNLRPDIDPAKKGEPVEPHIKRKFEREDRVQFPTTLIMFAVLVLGIMIFLLIF